MTELAYYGSFLEVRSLRSGRLSDVNRSTLVDGRLPDFRSVVHSLESRGIYGIKFEHYTRARASVRLVPENLPPVTASYLGRSGDNIKGSDQPLVRKK